jgi:hypothetical protein
MLCNLFICDSNTDWFIGDVKGFEKYKNAYVICKAYLFLLFGINDGFEFYCYFIYF